MENKIRKYIKKWESQGYPDGIPDQVPEELARQNLAPSHKALAVAILKNDHNLLSLGFSAPKSKWYNAIKRIEIQGRTKNENL